MDRSSKHNDKIFLADGGQTGTLIHMRDWSAASLGPIEKWLQSLKSVVALVFADARHPQLLGSKVRDGWPAPSADLARRISNRRRSLPALIISGYANIEGIAPDLRRLRSRSTARSWPPAFRPWLARRLAYVPRSRQGHL